MVIRQKMIKERSLKSSQKNSIFFYFGLNKTFGSPKYIVDGRIKYPIDDKLLQIYGALFSECCPFLYVKFFLLSLMHFSIFLYHEG